MVNDIVLNGVVDDLYFAHTESWRYNRFVGEIIKSKLNQGPHDRNFLVCINNENFLRGAIERNTRYPVKIFLRFFLDHTYSMHVFFAFFFLWPCMASYPWNIHNYHCAAVS